MRAPGEQARLHYDSPRVVEVGDYVRTGTGRTYLVTAVRVQRGGVHAGRQHLTTTVMGPDHAVPDDAVVHPLRWYAR